uniref:Secreted protein n=1 Tax=Heterorhabditis bacteriophora TaxID=37862 RepID=A0A1I7WR64_HETBA
MEVPVHGSTGGANYYPFNPDQITVVGNVTVSMTSYLTGRPAHNCEICLEPSRYRHWGSICRDEKFRLITITIRFTGYCDRAGGRNLPPLVCDPFASVTSAGK